MSMVIDNRSPLTEDNDMTKHTHKGTCQICGSHQAAKNGINLIAKHGYTTRWGFFSGVCRGADNLPLQISCDLIQASVDSVKAQVAKLTDTVASLNEQTGPEGFYHVYVPATWTTKSRYVWIRVTFVQYNQNGVLSQVMMVPNADDVVRLNLLANRNVCEMATSPAYRYGFYGVLKGCDDYAKHSRAKRADAYLSEIKNRCEYIDHQTEVLKNWAPSELIAVK